MPIRKSKITQVPLRHEKVMKSPKMYIHTHTKKKDVSGALYYRLNLERGGFKNGDEIFKYSKDN